MIKGDGLVAVPANEVNTKVEIQSSTSTIEKRTNYSSHEIEEIVREYFKDTPVLADIAYCESRFRQFDKNGEVFKGRIDGDDTGIMQINTRYHLTRSLKLGMDIDTIEGNLAYAKYLFEKEGTKPWRSSSKCWIPRSNLVATR